MNQWWKTHSDNRCKRILMETLWVDLTSLRRADAACNVPKTVDLRYKYVAMNRISEGYELSIWKDFSMVWSVSQPAKPRLHFKNPGLTVLIIPFDKIFVIEPREYGEILFTISMSAGELMSRQSARLSHVHNVYYSIPRDYLTITQGL